MQEIIDAIEINASPSEIMITLDDHEGWVDIMKELRKVTYLERCEDYSVAEWQAEVIRYPLRWVQKSYYKHAENRIEWAQVEGDFKSYGGYFSLEPIGLSTRLTMYVSFELKMHKVLYPLEALVARLYRENVHDLLVYLKKQAEQ